MLFVCLGPKAIFLNSLHSPVFQLLISTPLWVTVSHSYSKQPCIYFLTSDKEKNAELSSVYARNIWGRGSKKIFDKPTLLLWIANGSLLKRRYESCFSKRDSTLLQSAGFFWSCLAEFCSKLPRAKLVGKDLARVGCSSACDSKLLSDWNLKVNMLSFEQCSDTSSTGIGVKN